MSAYRQSLRSLRSWLGCEQLEDRSVPANLQMTGVQLLDGFGTAIAAPILGGKYQVRATWNTTGLTASNNYIVRISVDGIPLNSVSIAGQAGTGIVANTTLA